MWLNMTLEGNLGFYQGRSTQIKVADNSLSHITVNRPATRDWARVRSDSYLTDISTADTCMIFMWPDRVRISVGWLTHRLGRVLL